MQWLFYSKENLGEYSQPAKVKSLLKILYYVKFSLKSVDFYYNCGLQNEGSLTGISERN